MIDHSTLQARAQALRKKVKITDVKVMIVRGTWDWNLIKIETDAGVHGIGEAYWGPGVKDIILKRFRDDLIGEDPLHLDAGRRAAGLIGTRFDRDFSAVGEPNPVHLGHVRRRVQQVDRRRAAADGVQIIHH